MFALVDTGRAARWRELSALCAEQARIAGRITQLVRDADDARDWEAAGCASSAEWLALVSGSDYRTAVRITRTGEALRVLPALDEALATGALSLDQVAAAAEFATPETDAELARVAVGQPPSLIGVAARRLVPPVVADDAALYARRSLRMVWTRGRRELVLNGRLPLELGVVFEQAIWDIAKTQRAADKRDGVVLDWQQSAGGRARHAREQPRAWGRRSPATVIVHLSDDEAPLLEGAGPISVETAERLACDARRLTIQRRGGDLVHSRVSRCASYAQMRALYKRSHHCQYPGCSAARELKAHHLVPDADGGKTVIDNLILFCHRHHAIIHDHHIQIGGTAEHPELRDATGHALGAHQAHAPPCQ